MRKCLNWGWYGFENYGDDLLQLTILELFGDISIIFPMNLKYSTIHSEQIQRSYISMIKQASTCDALMVGPGGIFPYSSPLKTLLFYFIVKLWKKKNKRVLFFGIGISPQVDWLSKFFWRKIVKLSDLFFTRSDGFLEKCGIARTDKTKEIADVAFASSLATCYNSSVRKLKAPTIGISLANICGNNHDAYQYTIDIWHSVCIELLKRGYDIHLISFSKNRDDRMVDDIYNSVSNNREYAKRVKQFHYADVKEAICTWKDYEYTICNRFHSLVISVLLNIPALPIAYGHKTSSLAQKSGLGKYTLYWNMSEARYLGKLTEIEANDIINSFCLLSSDREQVISALKTNSKKLRISAQNASKYAITVLQQ